MIITALDRSPMPGRDVLVPALEHRFGPGSVEAYVSQIPGIADEFDINIAPKDESRFRVAKLQSGSITVNGLPAQNAVVAAIVRSLLPTDHARVVAVDPEANVYVDLVDGITADEIAEGWRNIAEGGL